MKTLFTAGVIGAVFIAGSIAFLWYEMRHALTDSVAAFEHARRTVPAQGPSPSNEECEDALMADVIGVDDLEALINATREDAPQPLAWGAPSDEEIGRWMDLWTEQQGDR